MVLPVICDGRQNQQLGVDNFSKFSFFMHTTRMNALPVVLHAGSLSMIIFLEKPEVPQYGSALKQLPSRVVDLRR